MQAKDARARWQAEQLQLAERHLHDAANSMRMGFMPESPFGRTDECFEDYRGITLAEAVRRYRRSERIDLSDAQFKDGANNNESEAKGGKFKRIDMRKHRTKSRGRGRSSPQGQVLWLKPKPNLNRLNPVKLTKKGLNCIKLPPPWRHFCLDAGMDDRWLSVDEIADYLGVAKDTIYTWVTSKGMPGHKVGRFWKFKKEDVDAWVREGGAAASSDDFDDKEPRNV